MNTNTLHSLDTFVFPDEIDFQVFEDILDTLDHVTPKRIPRSEFEALNGDFLKETGEDDFGKHYDLLLPEDLKKGELVSIIDTLHQRFELDTQKLDSFLSQVKTAVAIALRGQDDGEAQAQELSERYHISPELQQKIAKQKFDRDIIRAMKEDHDSGKLRTGRVGLSEGEKEGLNTVVDSHILRELELTFLRKSLGSLRYGMQVITQAEQQELEASLIREGYSKVSEDEYRHSGGGIVKIRTKDLETEPLLLREKCRIDEWKKKLGQARKDGNTETQEALEQEAANFILGVLYEYPYVQRIVQEGYKPKSIRETKEIYCVGFSILGHVLLDELEIEHEALTIPLHSALEVHIGGKKYLFDPTAGQKLRQYEYDKQVGVYHTLKFSDGEAPTIQKARAGNPEIVLMSQIIINLYTTNTTPSLKLNARLTDYNEGFWFFYNAGRYFMEKGDFRESIEEYKKTLSYNPESTQTNFFLGYSLFQIGDVTEALSYMNEVLSYYEKQLSKYDEETKNSSRTHPQLPFIIVAIKIRILCLYKLGNIRDTVRQLGFLKRLSSVGQKGVIDKILGERNFGAIEDIFRDVPAVSLSPEKQAALEKFITDDAVRAALGEALYAEEMTVDKIEILGTGLSSRTLDLFTQRELIDMSAIEIATRIYLTPEQIEALGEVLYHVRMTPEQIKLIGALSVEDIQPLSTAEILSINSEQIQAITDISSIGGLSPEKRKAVKKYITHPSHVHFLASVLSDDRMTLEKINLIGTSLSEKRIKLLSPRALLEMTVEQIAAVYWLTDELIQLLGAALNDERMTTSKITLIGQMLYPADVKDIGITNILTMSGDELSAKAGEYM